tara:strand:+ start:231 stop:629 length:399 start_codon:yes stop_codon:yes gene_type:complete
MIKVFKDSKIMELIRDICNEHTIITKASNESNVSYLWHMYSLGHKKGDFKPFIFLAELNLLEITGYITEVESKNMMGMLRSQDEDNAHMVGYSILTLRTARIKEIGLWTSDNEKYSKIDYIRDIINTKTFMK